ncbi:hypothetical protein P170DRAFT_232462 [Aspergillus steynii IBT 23096]|uniref:Uncharacterized protein n=1 Tax=Aspergillus steynii IBT 23096 TaxID=1392250 RepID=A0A2I2G2C6_9EURO|nr:uncharacterized protein P170DRAFT_232462 [Aspergillus steynii IBT 23096]PLB47043.1 hypothetical protein P170DRAFT_232462 [Aspergillus steynii IBT 23096]
MATNERPRLGIASELSPHAALQYSVPLGNAESMDGSAALIGRPKKWVEEQVWTGENCWSDVTQLPLHVTESRHEVRGGKEEKEKERNNWILFWIVIFYLAPGQRIFSDRPLVFFGFYSQMHQKPELKAQP